jgi:hypothetical protein
MVALEAVALETQLVEQELQTKVTLVVLHLLEIDQEEEVALEQ